MFAAVTIAGTLTACGQETLATNIHQLYPTKFRFLFNIGEGTQRLCMEHKIRLAKAEHAFFTRLSTDTLGGVPGEGPRSVRQNFTAGGEVWRAPFVRQHRVTEGVRVVAKAKCASPLRLRMLNPAMTLAYTRGASGFHNKSVVQKDPPLKTPSRAESASGMILTLSDIKNTGVKAEGEGGAGGKGDKRAKEGKTGAAMTLHGPPGLSEFYHATRHFMQRSDFPIAFDAVKVGSQSCLLQLGTRKSFVKGRTVQSMQDFG